MKFPQRKLADVNYKRLDSFVLEGGYEVKATSDAMDAIARAWKRTLLQLHDLA